MPTKLPAKVTRAIDGDTAICHIEKIADVVTTRSNYNKPLVWDFKEVLGLVIEVNIVKGKATLKMKMDKHIRVSGIDAYEHNILPQGPQAVALAKSLIEGKDVTLNMQKPDKYGRTLGDIILSDGSDFAKHMLDSKLAVPYGGGTKTLPQPIPNTTGGVVKVS